MFLNATKSYFLIASHINKNKCIQQAVYRRLQSRKTNQQTRNSKRRNEADVTSGTPLNQRRSARPIFAYAKRRQPH